MHLQEFMALKLRKEEGTVAMIKDSHYFNQRQIIIIMEKLLLILMRMDESNHPHTENLWFMIPMVNDHIRMSLLELNNDDYLPPIPELDDDEYKEVPGYYEPTEYLSDDEDISNTEDRIPYQYNNRLGGEILAMR